MGWDVVGGRGSADRNGQASRGGTSASRKASDPADGGLAGSGRDAARDAGERRGGAPGSGARTPGGGARARGAAPGDREGETRPGAQGEVDGWRPDGAGEAGRGGRRPDGRAGSRQGRGQDGRSPGGHRGRRPGGRVPVAGGAVVTLDDVARLAGVSLATASRVLGPASSRRVGSELRDRVQKAARQLGYTPNLAARALAHGASDVVGLIVHDLTDPSCAMLAEGVMRAAERRGLAVLISATWNDPEREIAHVATFHAQRARAVVLAGARVADERLTVRLGTELARFHEAGGRVACVGQAVLPADTVVPDNHGGAYRLATTLAALGHRRFAVLAGPPHLALVRERLAGFTEGLRAAGLPAPRVLHEDLDRDGGYAAAERLLAEGTDATCVFAVNDVMAVGALAALRAHGVAVPDEISLAGFDDIPALRDTVPALTTVRLPLQRMGERALDLALGSPELCGGWRTESAPGEVIVRESTRGVG
mgnify:CR=1 FL=1